MEYTPRKFRTVELVNAWNDGSLKINEEYQRGASWAQPQMQGLIDSIFRQYPIPPIFLQEIRSTGLGGVETLRYEIVDGQQRIRAMAEFYAGKFALLESTDKKLRLPNSLRSSPSPWGKRRFAELETVLKYELEKKEIDVFVIKEVVNADEVRDLFIRLQSGTALTRQQIRDAWPGTMGPFIEELAGKLNRTPSILLFNLVDRRGSRGDDESDKYDSDRQFCAQLLCIFLARERDPLTEQSISANDLDKLYHDNTTFDRNGESAKRFLSALNHSTEVFRAAIQRTAGGRETRAKRKFKKLDVISVFQLCQDLGRNPQFKFDKDFARKVGEHVLAESDSSASGKSTSGPTIANHYKKWRIKIIDEVGIRLDPKRLFDDYEKAAIYERDQGSCGICGERVEHADAEYDHFPTPHALGGKTALENGRLVHERCHPRGRPQVKAKES